MGSISLEHERLRLSVDDQSGAFRAIDHRGAGLFLIANRVLAARHPFMIVMQDGATLREWRTCAVERRPDGSLHIRWALDEGLLLEAIWRIEQTSGEARCSLALRNPNGVAVAALAYPYLAGIGRLGDLPAVDELTHPYATGFLVRDPLHTLPAVESETAGDQPVVLGLYPEGFSGSTMQFMAYGTPGRGGFYMATEDAEGHEKWLNFYRHREGDLRMAIWHGPTNYVAGRDVLPAYDIVLAALDGGTWYDAAERYREWAHTQPWTAQGSLHDRENRPRRLLEEVGLCTFGINPQFDRVPWLREIDRIAGTPVLHVLGPNWAKAEANYHNMLPGGLDDWFPARFHADNLRVMREHGDLVTPFEFNLLFGRDETASEAPAGRLAMQALPKPTFSRDAYDFPFLCPVDPFTRRLHVARDRQLAADWAVDGVYYDISVNNVRHNCLADTHGHAVGDNQSVSKAFRKLLGETGEAMRQAAAGRTIVQGTEMINEQMIPYIDFYQGRAEAAPAAPFEGSPFRALLLAGAAEKIPLFTYVYHEYGPLRLDGWAKLSREQGDYVYFVLGRTFIQGGLIELNYEFSPLEDLGERQDVAAEHYWRFEECHYQVDAELARYAGTLALARVGPANPYLAYGRMRPPAPLRVSGGEALDLEYMLYNVAKDWPEAGSRGTMRVPAVLQSAWSLYDDRAAWILLNLATEPRSIEIDLAPPHTVGMYGEWRLTRRQPNGASELLGALTTARTLTLMLPPRAPVLIEAAPPSDE